MPTDANGNWLSLPSEGGGGGGGGGFLGMLLSFLMPRAGGGDVDPGSAYMVGERGPEMFVPGSPGTSTA